MDLPGVGLIVHWDAALSLQQYVQQIGRGGRCGCQCLCITMFDRAFMKTALRTAGAIRNKDRRTQELCSIHQVLNHQYMIHRMAVEMDVKCE